MEIAKEWQWTGWQWASFSNPGSWKEVLQYFSSEERKRLPKPNFAHTHIGLTLGIQIREDWKTDVHGQFRQRWRFEVSLGYRLRSWLTPLFKIIYLMKSLHFLELYINTFLVLCTTRSGLFFICVDILFLKWFLSSFLLYRNNVFFFSSLIVDIWVVLIRKRYIEHPC